ncbi:unnamed protein product [Orchesella dallaii]|uniref:Uncharacterized protein n=1 Tax=Orchesella dallaii TaxID=48710 RepID=A0ABP1RHC2_9HEXA
MEKSDNHRGWPETRNGLLQPFQMSTLEIVWDETLQITTSIFMQYITLQGILLHYSTSHLLRNIENSSSELDMERMRGSALQHVLEINARIVTKQRFSAKEILLVSDSVFASSSRNFVLQSEVVLDPRKPIQLPTVIFTAVRNTLGLSAQNSYVFNFLSVTPLLFINLKDYSISIGCFTCEPSFSNNWKSTFKLRLTHKPLVKEHVTVENIKVYWRKIRSTLQFEHTRQKNCVKHSRLAVGSDFPYEFCEIYEEYFKYINCSNVMECLLVHINVLGVRKIGVKADGFLFNFKAQIFSCGLEQIDYTLQMIFPKVQFFDTNLTSFLTPFTLNIWLFTLAAIGGIAMCIIFLDSEKIFNSLFQIYSILTSQDAGQITGRQPGVTLIIIIWIFSTILLREAYNSSLYSFLTAEQSPKNFPRTIEELLDRNDFDLILPISFHDEVMFGLFFWDVALLPKSLATFYMKILTRAYFMIRGFYKEALETISSGGVHLMWHYARILTKYYTVGAWLDSTNRLQQENVTTKKFAVLCKGKCDTKWNIALLEKQGLERVNPKQNAFFRSFEFWTISYPTFLSFTFTKFLNPFVESGIHEWVINRYRLLEKIALIKVSPNMLKLRMKTNYSIVSYALFANERREPDNEYNEKPTKVSALTGTFIISGIMLGIASAVMVLELFI